MGRCKDDFISIYKGMGLNNALKLVLIPRICTKIGINYDTNKAIDSFIFFNFKDIIIKYKNETLPHKQETIPNIIWVFWWQGKNEMPSVIKQCYLSILRNANDRKVILLDKYNLQNYVILPNFIIQKFQQKIISFTHYSDIIRVELLKKYGGMWIDAGIYVTKTIPQNKSMFFSPKLSVKPTIAPHLGLWVMGVMESPPNSLLFNYMHDLLSAYWEKFDIVFSYLMFDYFIKFAYEHFNWTRLLIDNRPISSPNLHYPRYNFNKKVNEKKLTQLLENNTFLSLTYRIEYPIRLENGNLSYYSALLKRYNINYENNSKNGGG